MHLVKERLTGEHFIEEMMEFGFKVRACQPKLTNRTKEASDKAHTGRLLVVLDQEAIKFLRLIKARIPCSFCLKYYLF